MSERERLAALLYGVDPDGTRNDIVWDKLPTPLSEPYLLMADAVLADRPGVLGRVVEQVRPAPFVIEGDSDEELADLRAQVATMTARVRDLEGENMRLVDHIVRLDNEMQGECAGRREAEAQLAQWPEVADRARRDAADRYDSAFREQAAENLALRQSLEQAEARAGSVTERPHTLTAHERRLADAEIPPEG